MADIITTLHPENNPNDNLYPNTKFINIVKDIPLQASALGKYFITQQQGYLTKNDVYENQSEYYSKSTLQIACVENQVFMYKGEGRGVAYSVLMFNEYGDIVNRLQYRSTNMYTEVVIPSGVTSVKFSSVASISQDVIFDVYLKNGYYEQLYEINKPLSNKLWYACGDSFTEGDFTSLTNSNEYTLLDGRYKGKKKVYPYIIGNRTNINVINFAIGGMTLAYKENHSTINNCFSYPNGKYTQIPSNVEYITLYFGINDSNRNIPIGDINDSTNTTFYGAWNVVINHLLTNNANAKIGIIISNACKTIDYPIATINIAKKWGLSYLDINGDDKLPMVILTNMRNGLTSQARNYWYNKYKVSDTNSHPNALAHENESYMIQKWLEQL